MAGAGTLLVTPDTSGTAINTLPATGQDTMAGSLPVAIASNQSPVPVTVAANGLGAITPVPAATTNGTALGTAPAGKRGARLYVPPGASISFTIAAAQPSAAPTTITVANPSANTVPANWDEDLAGTQMIYVTAVTGSPLFRWY
jgi:hypothetical protein